MVSETVCTFFPIFPKGGPVYKGEVLDVKGFGKHKAGLITVAISSPEVYTRN